MVAVVILGLVATIALVAGHLAVAAFDKYNDPFVDRIYARQDAMEQDLIYQFSRVGREPPEWLMKAKVNHGKSWRHRKAS